LARSLDAERFQPWFYFYPSGAPLDEVSDYLARSLAQLEVAHGFEALAIVAHSAGGLVARGALLEQAHPTGRPCSAARHARDALGRRAPGGRPAHHAVARLE